MNQIHQSLACVSTVDCTSSSPFEVLLLALVSSDSQKQLLNLLFVSDPFKSSCCISLHLNHEVSTRPSFLKIVALLHGQT